MIKNNVKENLFDDEENIYVGYRYYETVDDTGGTFTVNGEDNRTMPTPCRCRSAMA